MSERAVLYADRVLPDGRGLSVYPLLHGMGRLGVGAPGRDITEGFTDEW